MRRELINMKKIVKAMIKESIHSSDLIDDDNFIAALLGIEMADNECIEESELIALFKDEGINSLNNLLDLIAKDVWSDYEE